MEKVIVTGGAGFIGSHLVNRLVEDGYDVHVIDNLSSGKKDNVHPKATLHIADIRDLAQIRPLFVGASAVFHLAALPSVQYSIEHPAETHEINVVGTQNVLIATGESRAKKFIYSASCAAYGDQEVMPLKESMPALPKSPYAMHKYVGEIYAKVWHEVYGLSTVSLRYFNVYGPRQSNEGAYASVVARFLKLKAEGKPFTVTGDGEQTRDYVNVKDVVEANMKALASEKAGKGEVINIGCGVETSVNTIAALIGGLVEYLPARLEPRRALADITLAKKLLDWEPKLRLEDGIKELLK